MSRQVFDRWIIPQQRRRQMLAEPGLKLARQRHALHRVEAEMAEWGPQVDVGRREIEDRGDARDHPGFDGFNRGVLLSSRCGADSDRHAPTGELAAVLAPLAADVKGSSEIGVAARPALGLPARCLRHTHRRYENDRMDLDLVLFSDHMANGDDNLVDVRLSP